MNGRLAKIMFLGTCSLFSVEACLAQQIPSPGRKTEQTINVAGEILFQEVIKPNDIDNFRKLRLDLEKMVTDLGFHPEQKPITNRTDVSDSFYVWYILDDGPLVCMYSVGQPKTINVILYARRGSGMNGNITDLFRRRLEEIADKHRI